MDDMGSVVLTPLVVQSGLACLGVHCLLYVLFAYVLPKGPWSELPSFTAHQVVCLPLMIAFTYAGFSFWFFSDKSNNSGQTDRILGEFADGAVLGQVVLGMMLFWDIPVGLVTPALNDLLMFFHHFGMACMSGVVAGVFSGGRHVGSYYGMFFFGVIEISSMFLAIVDIFHPKHKAWYQYLQQHSYLQTINEACRVLFAVSYLAVRAIYFPYVIATGAAPDFYHVATLPPHEREGVPKGVLYFVIMFAILFSALQMHWGVLVFNQVAKALGLIKSSKKKTKAS